MRWVVFWLLGSCAGTLGAAERINHEGRILGPLPVVAAPILFDTAAADAVVSAMQIMPVDSAWNEDVSRLALLSNSDAMIAQITSDLASSRRTLRAFFEMNYVLVPDNQPRLTINFFNYPDESDLDGGVYPDGLYPIPVDLPIESWPVGTGTLTLSQWQQNVNGDTGDRHSITVMPGQGYIWETWLTELDPGGWQASNGAKFNLNSNALRPAGWTSGDAAGLAMFPALVRYDECQRGMVEHAVRLVVKHSRLGPIYPATHQASTPATSDPNTPAMGQRVRLKASFVVPASWTTQEKAVLLALKNTAGSWPTTATSSPSPSAPTIVIRPAVSIIFRPSRSATSKSCNQPAPRRARAHRVRQARTPVRIKRSCSQHPSRCPGSSPLHWEIRPFFGASMPAPAWRRLRIRGFPRPPPPSMCRVPTR